jgi:hypothetical protein
MWRTRATSRSTDTASKYLWLCIQDSAGTSRMRQNDHSGDSDSRSRACRAARASGGSVADGSSPYIKR